MSKYAQVNVKFGADISQFSTAMQNAARQMQKAGDQLKAVGMTMTTSLTAPIVALGAAALYSFGQIDALKRGLISFAGSAELAETEFNKLREVAKLPGIGLEEAVKGSINLQAIGMSADDARTAMMAFGNAIATVGGGKENFDLAIRGFSQLTNASKPLQQDLYQIANQLPQVNKLMIEAFGTNRAEDLAAMGISGKQLAEFLVTELGKLPQVSGGIKNSFENMGDSVKIALGKVGEAIEKNFDISGKLNAFADWIARLVEGFSNLSPFVQKTLLVVVGLVAALGPLLVVFGSLVTLFPAIIAGFAVLSTVAPYLFAIGAAVAIIVKYREPLGAFFTEAIQYLKDFKNDSVIVGAAIDYVVFQLGKLFSEVKTILKSIYIVAKTILGGIAQLFNTWANIVKAIWSGDFSSIPSLISEFLSGEKENAVSGFKDLIQNIKDGYNDVYGEIKKKNIEGSGTVLKDLANPYSIFNKQGTGTVLRNGNTTDPAKATAKGGKGGGGSMPTKFDIVEMDTKKLSKSYLETELAITQGWQGINQAEYLGGERFIEATQKTWSRYAEAFHQFKNSVSTMMQDFVQNTIADFAAAMGEALVTQENPFENWGRNLLGSIGSFLKQMGALFIAYGVNLLLFQESLKSMNPYLAIAAGAALVAAGGAVTALSKKGLDKGSSGGSSGYSSGMSGGGEDLTLTTRIDGRDLVLSGQRTTAIGRR